jgi:hypothetical protein
VSNSDQSHCAELEPLADKSKSPCLYNHAIRLVSRVSNSGRKLSVVTSEADSLSDQYLGLCWVALLRVQSAPTPVYLHQEVSGTDFRIFCPTSYAQSLYLSEL